MLCLVLVALVLAGCSKRVKESLPPPPPPPPPPAAPPPPPPPPPTGSAPSPGPRAAPSVPKADFVNVDVFYATNRAPATSFATLPPGDRFTAGIARELTYGTARISIPKVHVPGELESPRWYLLEFKEDPKQHVVLQDVARLAQAPFFARLHGRVEESRGSNAFVFVHGYNVGFRDAARRTAQLAYDLRFDGAPVFYSWPSQAALAGYFTDEQTIARSVPLIEDFLADMADRSGAQNLYIIGHSMGTRGVTQAIRNLVTKRPELRGRFRGIILAAPDIDAKVFRTELAPAMRQASGSVTLYASSQDMALKASKQVNRGPRAGDTSEGVVLVSGVDTIDVSGVDQSMLAHSYFMESDKVMGDIREMFRAHQPAAQRKPLQSVKLGTGMFWKILPPP
jgi:esterase/lipase superfamily enzyme